MQEENPAMAANSREPRLPVGGALDWKEPFLTELTGRGIKERDERSSFTSSFPEAQMKIRDLTQIIVG